MLLTNCTENAQKIKHIKNISLLFEDLDRENGCCAHFLVDVSTIFIELEKNYIFYSDMLHADRVGHITTTHTLKTLIW